MTSKTSFEHAIAAVKARARDLWGTAPRRLTIGDAAKLAGEHPRTIRRALHAGLIAGDRNDTPTGFAYVFSIDEVCRYVAEKGMPC